MSCGVDVGGTYGGRAKFDHRSPNERGQQERCASVSCLWQGLLTEGLDLSASQSQDWVAHRKL